MQTFLPFADFEQSARVLDYRRLGKQRVEAYQLYRALTGVTKGWVNHPAGKMWRGHEGALCAYGYIICTEWVRRGYKDTMRPFFRDQVLGRAFSSVPGATLTLDSPPWVGDPAFHAAHRSQLLAKDPAWYGQWGWTEEPGALPYIWPAPSAAGSADVPSPDAADRPRV